jgi:hypothetical protein
MINTDTIETQKHNATHYVNPQRGGQSYGTPWTEEEKAILLELQFAGLPKLIAALPNRSVAAIKNARKRCGNRKDNSRPPEPIDINAVRARLRELPIEVFVDRLPELLERGAMFGRTRSEAA